MMCSFCGTKEGVILHQEAGHICAKCLLNLVNGLMGATAARGVLLDRVNKALAALNVMAMDLDDGSALAAVEQVIAILNPPKPEPAEVPKNDDKGKPETPEA